MSDNDSDQNKRKNEPLKHYGVNRDGHLIFNPEEKQGCAAYTLIILVSTVLILVFGAIYG